MKKILLILILILSCGRTKEKAEEENLRDLVYASILKSSECGNSPGYLILPVFNVENESIIGSSKKNRYVPDKRDTNNCTLAIIQQACPFKTYPLNCILIFKKYKIEISNPLEKKE